MSSSRTVLALLGVVMFCLFVVSFGDETLCASGCGNLMAPVFRLSYSTFGSWGVRALLVLASVFFIWGAFRVPE